MLSVGFHFVADDEPRLLYPAATFLDVGGARWGMLARERLVRPYFKGQLDPALFAQLARTWSEQGCRVVCGNEPNLPLEQWSSDDPASYRAWFGEVRRLAPRARLYWAGMSPGVAGWERWYDGAEIADGIAVHAYGSLDEIKDVVWRVRNRFPGKSLWLSEFNFAAGRQCDVDTWADSTLNPLFAWLADIGVEAATYFAYRWPTPDMHLPTPVDGAGTAVERVIARWAGRAASEELKKQEQPTMIEICPFATYRPIGVNYTPGRAGRSILAIVDHIADGYGSPFGWFTTDRGDDGSSAHFWVSRTGVIEQYRPLGDTCWANGPQNRPDATVRALAARAGSAGLNSITVAIEHEGRPADHLTAAQIAASRQLHAWLSETATIPLDRQHVLGHYQFDSVNRAYCPGPNFPWSGVMAEQQKPTTFDIQKERDALWAAAERMEKNGYPWSGQAVKAAVALGKGEK